jgi:transcription initiation factor TFIID TATA-box-binding protein
MSQHDVQKLLLELGGEASLSELSHLASKRYPNRSLGQYASERLDSMKQKGLVQELEGNRWRLTDKGKEASLETAVEALESRYETELLNSGVTVSNLVGTLDLNRGFDLAALASDLSNADYHPERYHSIIYSPNLEGSVTMLLPSSGRMSITGATSKEDLIEAAQHFIHALQELGVHLTVSSSDILIQNIVANYDFRREFDLAAIAVALGLENTEYEPEQFPGVIYRAKQNSTILLFRTGKCVITGSKSYVQVISALRETTENLQSVGVDLPTIEFDI